MDRKKKWAVRACAWFLVVMALATVLSRAAASVLVAKARTGRAERGRLTWTFYGEGSVAPVRKEQIFLWEGQQVEWTADPGARVKKGECLVRFRMEYLEEQIDKKEDEIRQLELQAAQQQVSSREAARVPQSAGAALTLQDAQEELADALGKETAAKEALDAYERRKSSEKSVVPDTDRERGGISGEQPVQDPVGNEPSESEPLESGSSESGPSGNEPQERQELEAALGEARQAVSSAEKCLKQARNSYGLACQEDAAQEINEANSAEAARLGAEAAKAQVAMAKKALQKLKRYKAANGEVTAKKNCIVLSCGVQPGAVTAGTEIMETGSGGFELRGAIKEEDREKIKAGTEISIEFQSGGKKTTVLERVTSEAGGNNGSGSGDVSSGQEPQGSSQGFFWYAPLPDNVEPEGGEIFTWTIETPSEKEYEQIIPLSALREDVAEAYCLVLDKEQQMLGTVEVAKRVPVTVLEKDGEKAAVNSTLRDTDRLIISSEKYIEEGDRIRPEE